MRGTIWPESWTYRLDRPLASLKQLAQGICLWVEKRKEVWIQILGHETKILGEVGGTTQSRNVSRVGEKCSFGLPFGWYKRRHFVEKGVKIVDLTELISSRHGESP